MSYARFGWGGSSVYVYLSVSGKLDCCACLLKGDFTTDSFDTTAQMIEHLEAHREAGHTVEDETIQRLKADAVENDEFCVKRSAELAHGD